MVTCVWDNDLGTWFPFNKRNVAFNINIYLKIQSKTVLPHTTKREGRYAKKYPKQTKHQPAKSDSGESRWENISNRS